MKSLLLLFKKLNEQQKKVFLISGGVFLFILSLIITLSIMNSNNYSDPIRELAIMDRSEVAKVVKAFQKDQIEIHTEDRNGQIVVSVEENDFKRAHLKLSTLDISSSKLLGWKLFEKSKLGKSTFDNNINYIRALEEELQMSVNIIDGIVNSKVKISIPKQTLFISNISAPKASVIVELQSGRTLNQKQITGIKNFIANSVEKLTVKNVEIINQNGISLEITEDGGMYSLAQEQMKYKYEVEEKIKNKILKNLSPVVGGLENITAEITIDFDYNKKNSYEEIYDPNSVIRSTKNKNLKLNVKKNEKIEGGIPGVVSNIAKDPSREGQKNDIIQDKKEGEAVTNFEISKKVIETTKKRYGDILKVGAAITFNTDAFKEKDLKVINEKIKNIVKSAINYDEARGDQISVEGFAFFKYEKQQDVKEQVTDVLSIIGEFFETYANVFKFLFVVGLLFFFYKKFILHVSDIKLLDEEDKNETTEMMKLRKQKLDNERKRLLEDQFEEENSRKEEERKKLERRIKDQINAVSELTEEDEIKFSELVKSLRETVKGQEEEMANLFENLLEANHV